MRTITITLIFAGLLGAQVHTHKVAPDLEGSDPLSNVHIIVQFDQAPTSDLHHQVLALGGRLNREIKLVKGGSYTVPASLLALLESNPNIVHISVDHKIKAKGDYETVA
jgi:hypothetical protein